jgi:hypothetical protein
MKKAEAQKILGFVDEHMTTHPKDMDRFLDLFLDFIDSMTTDTDPRLEVLGKVNQLLVEHGAFDNDDKLYYAFQDLCDIIESELRTKIKQEAEE